jgi:hypothetical protein
MYNFIFKDNIGFSMLFHIYSSNKLDLPYTFSNVNVVAQGQKVIKLQNQW